MATMVMKRLDKATMIAFGCSILLIAIGAIAEPNFLSVDYLLQQLQTASFLGIIATGVMLVILLGHIDLSIPWTIGIGGMMATAATGFFGEALGPFLAIPFGSRLRCCRGPRQRPWRCIPARAVDDLHARHECRGPGPDGLSHGRLCPPGPRASDNARTRHRAAHPRRAKPASDLAGGRDLRLFSC